MAGLGLQQGSSAFAFEQPTLHRAGQTGEEIIWFSNYVHASTLSFLPDPPEHHPLTLASVVLGVIFGVCF